MSKFRGWGRHKHADHMVHSMGARLPSFVTEALQVVATEKCPRCGAAIEVQELEDDTWLAVCAGCRVAWGGPL